MPDTDEVFEITQRDEDGAIFFAWQGGAVLVRVGPYGGVQGAQLEGVRVATDDQRGPAGIGHIMHPLTWPDRNHWAEQERRRNASIIQ